MLIKSLNIKGWKSIGDITLVKPNPFSVFVGPNASGKSNIFEALEFFTMCRLTKPNDVLKWFGGTAQAVNQNLFNDESVQEWIKIKIDLGSIQPELEIIKNDIEEVLSKARWLREYPKKLQFYFFSRIFVGNEELVKTKLKDDSQLSLDCANLEIVLKRILNDKNTREEMMEILQLLIPGFSKVEIVTNELSGSSDLLIYEEHLKKPLNKSLISDGTYYILCLLAAVYQSEKPQFLCIEEPENGLNPKVIKYLVQFFRDKCREKGHYIWLNTHSQSLVSELTTDEIILVDKVEGLTQVKQVKGVDLRGLKMDEALFTNYLGGGIPW